MTMTPDAPQGLDDALRLSDRITLLPFVHGSGDMAQAVREALMAEQWDCLALPLPPSVETKLEQAVEALPRIQAIILEEPPHPETGEPSVSFVPVDPCQPVIMAVRGAMAEGIARAYIDREVTVFEPSTFPAPDPYALKRVSLAAYAAALVTTAPAPEPDSQRWHRLTWMAFHLHELELDYTNILCLCPAHDWPWLRDYYRTRADYVAPETPVARPSSATITPETLYFVLGELPYVTELYERRRAELRSDRHLSLDGIKELLLTTRERWTATSAASGREAANWVTPHVLQVLLHYVRNLTLVDRRLTPDLYTLAIAAKQVVGDQFAITLLETATRYDLQPDDQPSWSEEAEAGIDHLTLGGGRTVASKNRLLGQPLVWRSLALRPEPTPLAHRRWGLQWDPFRQCSWPPEDRKIESFTSHVREQARALLGADLAKVDKFSTSLKDGIDLRESLRNWPRKQRAGGQIRPAVPTQGPSSTPALGGTPTLAPKMDIYVKEIPPARGNVEVVVFLFDTPADPARYTWRATWYAEHQEESTLAFYATDFLEHLVGPGIGQSQYGGAMFLFPPRPLPDLWTDESLAYADTLEDRLIAGAARHSRESHIVLVAPGPPRAQWRRIARRYGKRLIHIPLARFSASTVDRLRRFHVLNGHEIRSYAAGFIR